MFPFIVADIGGTNARFALVTEKKSGQFVIEQVRIFKGADFTNFDEAMAAYVESLNDLTVKAAAVAIAGPISGDIVSMTNLPWQFSQEALRKRFGLQAFWAINDYTALAVATSCIPEEGLSSVVAGLRNPVGNKAILGPGTGLGVAGLARAGDIWLPIPSEGGHANIAPATEFECEVVKVLMRDLPYVSAESCLSGPGLENLHKAVLSIQGHDIQSLTAKDITERALGASDAGCRQALDLFCGFLGSVSGNLALTYGASGGVYITGGIVPRFVDYLIQSPFVERFKNKGVMSHYLAEVPVDVVSYDQPAFLGAAAWVEQSWPSIS